MRSFILCHYVHATVAVLKCLDKCSETLDDQLSTISIFSWPWQPARVLIVSTVMCCQDICKLVDNIFFCTCACACVRVCVCVCVCVCVREELFSLREGGKMLMHCLPSLIYIFDTCWGELLLEMKV